MTGSIFTDEDIKRIEAERLTEEKALAQLEFFRMGAPFVRLNRPCMVGDGITVIPEEEREGLIAVYDGAVKKGRMTKFVPASGAASRMFRDWYKCYESKSLDSDPEMGADFAGDLDKYAFYDDLSGIVSREGYDVVDLIRDKKFSIILEYILTVRGLNYAHLPKALLKFHVYPDHNRTSLEEHMVEAALYVRDAGSVCRIHCTVSEEHKSDVGNYFSRVREYYENRYGVTFDFRLSAQFTSTNTIAVDMENRPFRDSKGILIFRPGGHGALLKNLNAIDGDIIFLKNIDNIVPDRLKEITVRYKKILGGYLVRLQEEIFKYLRLLSSEEMDKKFLSKVASFCEERLHIVFPPGFEGFSDVAKKDFLVDRLNRPLRVCGMVKNVGEPGGGPFWVEEEDGTQSLQIIEGAQIDMGSEQQREIWTSATHFNPVDLVCGVRDYRSEKFDLDGFVDRKTVLITQKSEEGRNLKALELPGLWNGSMAYWNTIFVEVPIETFNPVKTVNDLLRKQHMAL
ncbi:MAG: DUF4301 family protein [Thermodesulfobacteriota bacterium]|nr:DUF4301 family protein [Thermodesulfobacteriota bacterium]